MLQSRALHWLLLFTAGSYCLATGPILSTHLGKFEGTLLDLGEDGMVERYYSIPYAKPPVNELRFEKPLDGEPSSELRSAINPGPACKQPRSIFKNITTSEDCLHLGVLKPVGPSPDPRGYPVLFFIHAGGYQSGHSTPYLTEEAARNFASKGIVVIVPQYRLSFMGFGTTGSNAYHWGFSSPGSFPGNYGLWDLRRALLWTLQNVNTLGIDYQRITVGGISSGASAAGLLSVSEKTHELFSQSLQISGSPFNDWSLGEKAVHTTERISHHLHCDFPHGSEVKECIRKYSYEEIMAVREALRTPADDDEFNPVDFTPHVDFDFFADDVNELVLIAHQKPTMISITESEGIAVTLNAPMSVFGRHILTAEEQKNFGRDEFVDFVSRKLAIYNFFGEEAGIVEKRIVDYYLADDPKNATDNMYYLQKYAKLVGDLLFTMPHLTDVGLKTKRGWPVYQLLSTYNKRLERIGFQPHGVPLPTFRAATHGMEHGYLFGNDFFSQEEFNEDDLKFRRNWVNAIVNFVKNKTPETAEEPNFKATDVKPYWSFSVMDTEVRFRDNFLKKDYTFWEFLGGEFGIDLIRSAAVAKWGQETTHNEL